MTSVRFALSGARSRPDRTHDYRVVDLAIHPDHAEDESPHVVGSLAGSRHGPRGDRNTDECNDLRHPPTKSDPGRDHDQQHRHARRQLLWCRDRRGDPSAQDLRLVPRREYRGAHQAFDGSSSGRCDDPVERLPLGVLVHGRARLDSDHSGTKAPEATRYWRRSSDATRRDNHVSAGFGGHLSEARVAVRADPSAAGIRSLAIRPARYCRGRQTTGVSTMSKLCAAPSFEVTNASSAPSRLSTAPLASQATSGSTETE